MVLSIIRGVVLGLTLASIMISMANQPNITAVFFPTILATMLLGWMIVDYTTEQ